MSGMHSPLVVSEQMFINVTQNPLLNSGWRAWALTPLMLVIMNTILLVLKMIIQKSLNLALLMNKG